MDQNVTHLSAYQRTPEVTARRVQPGQPYRPFGRDERPAGDAPKRFVAKGHDAQLQDAQHGKFPVEVITMGGEMIKGTIARRDKFTITLTISSGTDAGCDMILYKHAIESVLVRKNIGA